MNSLPILPAMHHLMQRIFPALLVGFFLLCTSLAGLCQNAEGDHILAVGDSVSVSVYDEPELDARTTINKTGKISLNLVGEINIVGLTCEQAARTIESAFKKGYLVTPNVKVASIGFAKKTFTMIGEVNKPGAFQFGNDPVTLLQAIGMAGGYTKSAQPKNVTITRTNKAGKSEAIKVDADKLAKSADAKPFQLQDGDQIFVDKSWY